MENIGTTFIHIYSCKKCYDSNDIFVYKENGVKICEKPIGELEGCKVVYSDTTSIKTIYNCTECSSLIDIISINKEENIIEFKCLGKEGNHGKKIMQIKEYLTKMEKYNNKETNNDTCNIHNKSKYISYCFDCNKH